MTSIEPERRQSIDLEWLVRLRWGAIAGQLGLIALARWVLDVELPLSWLLLIIAVEALSNLALARRAQPHEQSEGLTLVVLAFDMLLLTALLWLSGGSSNPFSFLYLVHIAVAAVVLPQRWTWGLAVFSVLCSGAVFFFDELSGPSGGAHAHHGHDMRIHLQGMWVAFVVAASFIAFFVQRIRRQLTQREEQLARAQQRSARNERLASLATLAAGAAHELSTPLSTIAVVAAELDALHGSPDDLQADAQLIRQEVERCRRILNRLSADTGSPRGAAPETLSIAALLDHALADAPWRQRLQTQLPAPACEQLVQVPPDAVGSALRSLIDNAFDALGEDGEVWLRAQSEGGFCQLSVQDNGSGMSEEVVERALEPFFTTKPQGRGMGLGLFLARAVAESLGGELSLRSKPGEGTTATLRIPLYRATSAGA